MSSVNRQWRSLEELANDKSFVARAAAEFPLLADALTSEHDRRRVIKLMAAAFAAAGLSECDLGAPGGHLIPAVKTPPNIIPGIPNFYATAEVMDGYAAGVVIEHYMGRPIKVEGNPNHPASLGATSVFAQARVLGFYDPERAFAISQHGLPATRQHLEATLAERRKLLSDSHGEGLRILSGAISSPTLATQLEALFTKYPQARWTSWQPISRENVSNGARLAYGQAVEQTLHIDEADVIVAIDSDLVSSAPGHLRYARDLASRRNPVRTQKMSRIYAIESTPTLTGVSADHRFIASPREIHDLVEALAAGILQRSGALAAPDWLSAIIADLTANKGRSLVHIGPDQSAETHALAHVLNEALGARGNTLDLIEPVIYAAEAHEQSLAELTDDMRAGKVSTLLVIDSNPVYAAPGTLGFAEALKRVEFSLALSPEPNETNANDHLVCSDDRPVGELERRSRL